MAQAQLRQHPKEVKRKQIGPTCLWTNNCLQRHYSESCCCAIKIGSGAFSVVFEASWLAPSVLPWAATRTIAAKRLYNDQNLKRIEDELRFLRMLR